MSFDFEAESFFDVELYFGLTMVVQHMFGQDRGGCGLDGRVGCGLGDRVGQRGIHTRSCCLGCCTFCVVCEGVWRLSGLRGKRREVKKACEDMQTEKLGIRTVGC